MKINQLKAGVVLSYGTQIVHILSGILYTPIMIRMLGQSEYGLYQMVSSVVTYLNLLSLGFSSGYIRFYARYKADDDDKGIAMFNGMFAVIFIVIAALCLICGSILVIKSEGIFGSGLTTAEHQKAKTLMAIMIFSVALSMIGSIFNCYIIAHERFFFQKILTFLSAILNPFLSLTLLFVGFGSIGIVASSTFISIMIFLFNARFCLKTLKMKFSFKNFDFGVLKEMWGFTFFIFINMIVDQINWSVDKFLLGRMIGTVAVAVYGIAATINSMYLQFSSAISSVFVPKVNKIIAEKQDDAVLTQLFTKVGRIQFLILGLIATGYALYGKEFMHFWAGEGYEESYYIGLFLILPVTVPLIQNLGIEIQRAKNKHKVRSIVYFIIAISNIFVSIWLINIFGTVGAAVGTAISFIIGNIIFMNFYYQKLGLNMLYFWKNMLQFASPLALSIFAGIVFKNFVPPNSIVLLAFNIVVYSAIYVIFMWLLGMNESEKSLIYKPKKV